MSGRRVAFRRSAAWHEVAHATAGYLLARAAPTATLEPPEAPAAAFVSWRGPAWAPEEVPAADPPTSAMDAATAVAAVLVSAAGPACDAILGLPEADVARRGRFDLAAVRPAAAAVGGRRWWQPGHRCGEETGRAAEQCARVLSGPRDMRPRAARDFASARRTGDA